MRYPSERNKSYMEYDESFERLKYVEVWRHQRLEFVLPSTVVF